MWIHSYLFFCDYFSFTQIQFIIRLFDQVKYIRWCYHNVFFPFYKDKTLQVDFLKEENDLGLT